MINTIAPGSGFHHSFKLALVITAASLLRSCSSAPTGEDPWWYHPCDTDINKIRHERSANHDLTHVKNHLKIFVGYLSQSNEKIRQLYKEHTTKKTKLKWLRIQKMLNKIRKAPNNGLREFYDALQRFAGTLESLRHKGVQTSALRFNQAKRDTIYQNITYQMRSLLCEVQENFNHDEVPRGISLKDMKIKLPKRLDFTAAQMYDTYFFKKMTSFFKNVLRNFNKRKSKKKGKKSSEIKNKKRT